MKKVTNYMYKSIKTVKGDYYAIKKNIKKNIMMLLTFICYEKYIAGSNIFLN